MAIKMSRLRNLLSSHYKYFLPNSRPAATRRPLCKRHRGTGWPRGSAVPAVVAPSPVAARGPVAGAILSH